MFADLNDKGSKKLQGLCKMEVSFTSLSRT